MIIMKFTFIFIIILIRFLIRSIRVASFINSNCNTTNTFNTCSGNDFITIQKTYLEVYNLPVMISGMQLSALGYYEKSLITNYI